MGFVALAMVLASSCAVWRRSEGHGRLIEPPSRASAWRYGFHTPPNYNDHELFCGGYYRQWQKNAGKCGVCGDAWDLPPPRPHEGGGVYGQGVVVRRYQPAAPIGIRVELTASHMGYFEFALCPDWRSASQDCLDANRLRLVQRPHEERYYPRDGNRIYDLKYRLPNTTCAHCLLQWRYVAGNNWGKCANGSEAVGCGPQEEFRACADVSIEGRAQELEYNATQTPAAPQPPAPDQFFRHNKLVGALVTLLVVAAGFGVLFAYYYGAVDGVMRAIKRRSRGIKAPVPPPRQRRARDHV